MHTFHTPGAVRLSVSNGAGLVTVDAVDTTETTVSLTPGDSQAEKLVDEAVIEQRGDQIVVRLPRSRGGLFRGRQAKVDIDVRLPTGSSVKAELESSDLRTTGELETLIAKLGSGDATVDTVTGTARVDSGSGNLRLDRCDGAMKASSGSGDISAGAVRGRAITRSGSGDVVIEHAAGLVSAGSGSGDIVVRRSESGVTAKTGSGDVQIGEATEGEVSATTASGDVEVAVTNGTAVWLDLNTVSGDVRSDLDSADGPGETDRTLELRVKTASGDISVARA